MRRFANCQCGARGRCAGRAQPLVAASIGPYGAYLADGSEYRGDYGISTSALHAFHLERWRVLAQSQADLLACETIPSAAEVAVLLELLTDTPDCFAWFSLSCEDGRHICDGTPLIEMARLCDAHPRVAAFGINCSAPEHIGSLIKEARRGTTKPIVVYPNSGERYDAVEKRWYDPPECWDWHSEARNWRDLGACCIGGCCPVGPDDIARLRGSLKDVAPDSR